MVSGRQTTFWTPKTHRGTEGGHFRDVSQRSGTHFDTVRHEGGGGSMTGQVAGQRTGTCRSQLVASSGGGAHCKTQSRG